MKHLNAKERNALTEVNRDYFELRYDYPRRLRNALIALAAQDRAWMVWVEREIDPRWSLDRITEMVEARARALLLKQYHFFGRRQIGDLIFRDWPFTDSGALSPG